MSASGRLPGTSAARHGADDRLIGMTAAHAAFRRDLRLLATAATAANLARPARRESIWTGWVTLKNQMHKHHGSEDTFIWPRLRERLSTSAAAVSVLDEMVAEHLLIDPLIAAVDDAFTRPAAVDPADAIDELVGAVSGHLQHEEREALPMIGEALSDEEWTAANAEIRQAGMASVAEYLPWLTDGVSDAETERIVSLLPPPLRAVYHEQWKPAYDGASRW